MDDKKEKLKYYYKKPGCKIGDPSIIMSTEGNISSRGGEIIIGSNDYIPPVNQMIVVVVRSALDPEFHRMIEKQKQYFGEKHYEPVRQEIISLSTNYVRHLKDAGINLPMEVLKVIFSGNWQF